MPRHDNRQILLLNMPWARPTYPALGLSLLKAILAQHSFSCDIAYMNIVWAEMVHARLSGPDSTSTAPG